MNSNRSLVASIALALFAVCAPASAQEDNWEFRATAYGWIAGLTGTIETPVGEFQAEVGFGDILESLDIAFLGAFEARYKKLSLITDLQYFNLSTGVELPTGALFSGGEANSETVIWSNYVTYALFSNDTVRFDAGGGFRYTFADIDVGLVGQEPMSDVSIAADGDYVDLLLAARLSGNFTDKIYGYAFGDVGGFGIENSSDLTWQLAGALGYRLTNRWSVLGGYRHISIKREFSLVDTTTTVSGPFIGFQAAF